MRVLKFNVDRQIITLNPECDFSGLVPGTNGYIKAEFSFSSEWDKCVKVASFWSMLGEEYEPQVLTDGKSCYIPEEALKRRTFKVQVLGRGKDFRLTTNKVEVIQEGGKV